MLCRHESLIQEEDTRYGPRDLLHRAVEFQEVAEREEGVRHDGRKEAQVMGQLACGGHAGEKKH